MGTDIIWLTVGFALGYLIAINARARPKTVVLDQQLAQDLKIAQNLNKSLLDDKQELQQKLWLAQSNHEVKK